MVDEPKQTKSLQYPKKTIVILDDNGGRAAHCAKLIKEHFGCQAVHATTEAAFIKILQAAQAGGYEITGIIADQAMEVRGSEIIDDFARGKFEPYYKQSTDPDASSTGYLLITGDANLVASGEAGVEKALVLSMRSWKNFMNNPQSSAIGGMISSWLGIPQPSADIAIMNHEIADSQRAGRVGVTNMVAYARDRHDDEEKYKQRSRKGD